MNKIITNYVQFSVGIMSYYGDWMRKPFERVYWGGSERAISGFNWMEGAIQRGVEITTQLQTEKSPSSIKCSKPGHWQYMANKIHQRISQQGNNLFKQNAKQNFSIIKTSLNVTTSWIYNN